MSSDNVVLLGQIHKHKHNGGPHQTGGGHGMGQANNFIIMGKVLFSICNCHVCNMHFGLCQLHCTTTYKDSWYHSRRRVEEEVVVFRFPT